MRKRTGRNIECVVCGNEFYKPACHIKEDTKYCSKKCFYEGRPKQTNTGKTHFKKGIIPWNKDVTGYMGANKTSFKKGNKPWNTGTGNQTDDMKIRSSLGYIAWRQWIFKRDNYTCQKCGEVGGKLNAHHIIYFKDDRLGRLDRENGVTLCIKCHKKVHTKETKEELCCRWSPTLGDLESTHEEIWGTRKYTELDKYNPTVFFGCYSLPDFYTIWRHQGKRYILWAGSDISRFQNGYHLEDGGNIRIDSTPLAQWIEKNCESWVENEVERRALEEMGITAKVCPSFMGNVDDYDVEYKHAERPQVYLSVSGDNFELYGWDIVEQIADQCGVDFHLYGNTKEWNSKHSNVFVHGRIPKEQMNEEIKGMQCGLRLCVEMDGASEITMKSALWHQHPITAGSYKYPHIDGFRNIKHLIQILNRLKHKTEPNTIGRNYYLANLNKFPWNTK